MRQRTPLAIGLALIVVVAAAAYLGLRPRRSGSRLVTCTERDPANCSTFLAAHWGMSRASVPTVHSVPGLRFGHAAAIGDDALAPATVFYVLAPADAPKESVELSIGRAWAPALEAALKRKSSFVNSEGVRFSGVRRSGVFGGVYDCVWTLTDGRFDYGVSVSWLGAPTARSQHNREACDLATTLVDHIAA